MQAAVQSRNISCVVHFTRLGNLNRILSEGLKPRGTLAQEEQPFLYCDELRLDRHTDAICLSVSFPNYKMFYSARCANPAERWAVLRLSPSILWTKDCAFFKTNAANAQSRELNIEDRKSPAAFLELFDEVTKTITKNDGTHSVNVRASYNLPIQYTTDPQAEVLCFDCIENTYINNIFFQSDADKLSIQNIPSHITAITDIRAFNGRIDFEAWR